MTNRYSRTVRYFPDKLPIGLASPDQIVLIFVVTVADERIPSVPRGAPAPSATTPPLDDSARGAARVPCRTAAHTNTLSEFVAPPLRPGALDDFRWFCQARMALEEGALSTPSALDVTRDASARRAFGAPRFYAACRVPEHENWTAR